MRPYAPNTLSGRNDAGHRVHHKTADNPKEYAKAVSKRLKHAARQEGRTQCRQED